MSITKGGFAVAVLAGLAALAWNQHTSGQAILPETRGALVIIGCVVAGALLCVFTAGRRRLRFEPAEAKGKFGGSTGRRPRRRGRRG
jgi:hypothetical protein